MEQLPNEACALLAGVWNETILRRSIRAYLGDGVVSDAVVNWHRGFRMGNNPGLEVKEHRIDTSAKSWHLQAGTLLSLTSANLSHLFANRPCALRGDVPLLAKARNVATAYAFLAINSLLRPTRSDCQRRASHGDQVAPLLTETVKQTV